MFLPGFALGAGGGEFPLSFVLSQIFNFSLFALALFFLLRKKIPGFLKQKNQDFTEYEEKARKLEAQSKSSCLLWRKKMEALKEKENNLPQMVAKALKDLKTEMSLQKEQALKNQRAKKDQEIKRLKIKEFGRLKTRLLFQVMDQAQKKLKLSEKDMETLNTLSIQKWEKM